MNIRQNQAPTGATLLQPGLERRVAVIVDRGDAEHLVPGTHTTMDALHRFQLLGRQLQARAMARALGNLLGAVTWPLRKAAGNLRRARREGASIRALGALDDHLLADIGISREQIPAAVAGLLEQPAAANPSPPVATLVRAGGVPTACNDAHASRAA